jgi:transposase-like protein
LEDLYHRGLRGKSVRIIITDGCERLLASLDKVYFYPDKQPCWTYKMRNILNNKVRKSGQKEVKAKVVKIYLSENKREAIKSFFVLFHFINEKWGKKPLSKFTQNS